MEQLREKDGIDVGIDFFLGAIVGVLVGSVLYFALRQWAPFASGMAIWIFLFGGFAIGGSLTGLLRNRVRKKPKKGLMIAPTNECLSLSAKIVLWVVLALGCLSFVGLHFLPR